MLASLLWTVCGALAALIAAFRVQLALLSWDPFSGWGALIVGLGVGALALVLVFTTGVWKCSLLGTCLLALVFSAGCGGWATRVSHPPNRALLPTPGPMSSGPSSRRCGWRCGWERSGGNASLAGIATAPTPAAPSCTRACRTATPARGPASGPGRPGAPGYARGFLC